MLFKKVRVPIASDIWQSEGETEDGLPMVVSAEFVAQQVKEVIERREQWLRDNALPLDTLMNKAQKDAFLAEVKAEYHGSADQKRRQEAATAAGKNLQAGKKQRWSRETQRRGGTTQMFHLLSFLADGIRNSLMTSQCHSKLASKLRTRRRKHVVRSKREPMFGWPESMIA